VGIESSRTSAAEAAIAPVKDALRDYDFAAQLRSPVERELRRIAWINLQTLRVEVAPDDKRIEAGDRGQRWPTPCWSSGRAIP